ncbi:unnamed protein product, partial [Prorocentrum cordatum]
GDGLPREGAHEDRPGRAAVARRPAPGRWPTPRSRRARGIPHRCLLSAGGAGGASNGLGWRSVLRCEIFSFVSFPADPHWTPCQTRRGVPRSLHARASARPLSHPSCLIVLRLSPSTPSLQEG